MRPSRLVLAAAVVLLAGCATQQVAQPEPTANAADAATLAQLERAEQRQADRRTQRWLQRKQMCRTLNVRFDSSGLCW